MTNENTGMASVFKKDIIKSQDRISKLLESTESEIKPLVKKQSKLSKVMDICSGIIIRLLALLCFAILFELVAMMYVPAIGYEIYYFVVQFLN